MIDVIKEYLVAIGFHTDKTSELTAKKSLQGVDKAVSGVGSAFGQLRTSMIAASAAIIGLLGGVTLLDATISMAGKSMGNVTMGVDKFALSLYTSSKNARNLQSVMSAMGVDSLEDLKYINLIPEQRKQFTELRQLANSLAPDRETMEGLGEIRKMGFEFQKMQLELSYTGLKLLGTLGELMRTPLFRLIPSGLQVLIDYVAYIVEWMQEHLPKNAVGTLAGGGIGATVGGIAGASLGGAAGGAVLGPIGVAAGAIFGRAAGAAAGAALGGMAGASIQEHLKELHGGNKHFRKQYKAFAEKMADKWGVDRTTLKNLITTESGWNPNALSHSGAVGIAQFMPNTAKGMGVDPNDPYSSIEGAARYLHNALIHYKGNYSKAVASYNAGFGAVDKYHGVPPFAETQNYVRRILSQTSGASQAKKSASAQPLQVSINVHGAGDPNAVAQAVSNKLQNLMNTRNLQPMA